MLYISLVVSAILLLEVNLIASRAKRPVGLIIANASAFGLASIGVCLVMLPPVLLQAVLVCVTAWFWGASHGKPRHFLALSCAATVVAFAIPGYFAFQQTRHLQEVFPYVSMDDRLPTQRKQRPSKDLPAATWDRLSQLEDQVERAKNNWLGDWRMDLLRAIHEDAVQIFVTREGFGVSRANGLREHLLKRGIRKEPPIPQSGALSPSPWVASSPQEQQKASEGFRSLHDSSVVDFVHPEGFGYIKDRRHVVGFQEHQISQMPEPADRWALQRLDLLSLLLHEEPVAYVTDHLPRMKELRAASTRELDDFESVGLPALQRGEDLFVRSKGQELRMLGALRAARQCLACHEAERGDLLGAFSYRMMRDGK